MGDANSQFVLKIFGVKNFLIEANTQCSIDMRTQNRRLVIRLKIPNLRGVAQANAEVYILFV